MLTRNSMIEFGFSMHLQTFSDGSVDIYLMRTNTDDEYSVVGVHFTTEKELSSAKKNVFFNLIDNIADIFWGSLDFKDEIKNPRSYYPTKEKAINAYQKGL